MSRVTRLIALWACLATTMLLAAVANAAGSGLVYEVEGPNGRFYLAGSMHLLPADRAELPAPLERAYRDSASIVMEIDTDDADAERAGARLLEAAQLAPGVSLPALLGEARWSAVRAALAEAGFDAERASRFEPWRLALLLTQAGFTRQGYTSAAGVEQQLTERARRDGKPISGLETAAMQIALLDGLEMNVQRQMLDLTLEELQEMPQMLDELDLAWRAGDLPRLEALLLEGYRQMPELYTALLVERNQRWVSQIRAWAPVSPPRLVLVGALHLVGEQGLPTLLQGAGYKTRRLTHDFTTREQP
ncbi:MAG: TraB/GumN family protein [Nevskiaceae bacterium]